MANSTDTTSEKHRSDENGDGSEGKPFKTPFQEKEGQQREKNVEEARKVIITEDTSLPTAKAHKIKALQNQHGERVKVFGWNLFYLGKNLVFVVLRDGTGFLQCILADKLCQTYDAIILSTEATICVYGVVHPIPEGQTAPGNQELVTDYFEVIGHSPSSGADTLLNEVCLFSSFS
ncbi:unnamed protein product [Adineta steineri]|uniref:Uncharacterized protein n=1 Tax=Adineta steineri TaxID=433720 RepID=A0A819HM08_9BILA|nr:unnamed protein product [Adineta steineri]CAF3903161.1 unnamed protein product [Adineta steineri]